MKRNEALQRKQRWLFGYLNAQARYDALMEDALRWRAIEASAANTELDSVFQRVCHDMLLSGDIHTQACRKRMDEVLHVADVSDFTPNEHRVFHERYISGKRTKDIAAELNYVEMSISRMETSLLEKAVLPEGWEQEVLG